MPLAYTGSNAEACPDSTGTTSTSPYRPSGWRCVEECIDTLFGWDKFVAKPYLLGYRLTDDMHEAALYFRPVPAAGALSKALASPARTATRTSTRRSRDARYDRRRLGRSHRLHDRLAAGVGGPPRAGAAACERERPELAVRVVDVLRPGDGRAQTDYLYQAFIRIGLLGPLRNTFEMQARTA